MNQTQYIQNATQLPIKGIENTLQLLSEDCTIPFISRYRKDQTGNLDEVQIEQIFKLNKQFEEIFKRKESILKSIEEQGQLSPELKQKLKIVSIYKKSKIFICLIKRRKKPKPMLLVKKVWNRWLKSSWLKTAMILNLLLPSI
jgi:uncharacterized protein